MSYAEHGSFKFGGIDMYDTYGIMILDTGMPKDSFIPAIRSRKLAIPQRHGEYDFGAKYYEDRSLTLDCVTAQKMEGYTFRTFAREVTYALSKKSEIRLWNEPDKYYIGRIYEEIELTQLRNVANTFTITFVCEPFAYGESVYDSFNGNKYVANYRGTASTPAYITITNNGNVPIKNIRISQLNRKDTY